MDSQAGLSLSVDAVTVILEVIVQYWLCNKLCINFYRLKR